MTDMEKVTGMTDADCEVWDDYYTRNPPDIDVSKNRVKQQTLTVELKGSSAAYIKTAAETAHKTPAQIIGELVREKLAAAG
jgi:hypothetical protein